MSRMLPLRALLAACVPLLLAGCSNVATVSWGIANRHTESSGVTMADVSLVITKPDGVVREVPLGRRGGCGEKAAPDDGPLLTLSCERPGERDDFRVRTDATNVLVIELRETRDGEPAGEFVPVRSLALEDGVMIVPEP